MPVLSKLIELDEAVARAEQLRRAGQRLVLTNGCFDLFHPGHIVHLQQARDLGEALFVAINSDRSARELKGPDRPVYSQAQRALTLSALECVDVVIIFEELDAVSLIEKLRPDVYVKGGDYTLDTINQKERKVLDQLGVEIHILPQIEDFSTTNVIKQVQNRS